MIQNTPRIDLLPEHLIDQIKAGEVIERPGNLVKEILENAVDAGSTKLELIIKNNGLDLISLKDNGHGMKFNDLPLAFSRHATSKISRFEDLYSLNSFGFRGEALASIAAISKIKCISKSSSSASAAEFRIEGGEVIFHEERKTSPFDHGTELIIQDLFYNTPARLKFIQSHQSEKTFLKKIIFAFILSHPKIEFQIKFDDNEKEIFSAHQELIDRINDLFPKAKNLIMSSQRFYENNELEVVLIPGAVKAPSKIQYVFINDRFILDKQLHRVISNGLTASFGQDDFHYIVNFFLPPDTIDVNVHPNKTVIKVMEMSKVIGLLSSTIKDLAKKQSTPSNRSANPFPSQQESLAETLPHSLLERELSQERHHYNMEGYFSPHNIPFEKDETFFWIEKYFIKNIDQLHFVFSSQGLLELFSQKKMSSPFQSIPLLVSEPFSAKGISLEHIKRLNECGLELEYLGKETIVLRSIPDWMNGFPLRPVVQCLIDGSSFSKINISPSEWSQSTWEEMIDSFPISELISNKVAMNLGNVLREKFK